MEDLVPIQITVSIPSQQEADHIHPAGTAGRVVEHLGGDAYLLELRVDDASLEGGAWYEAIEAYEHEFERVPLL